MPEKDGSEDKKSTKSVINKKQKQFMNQEEQLDLSSVAESFGGQIVGEPVELDEVAPAIALGGYLLPTIATAIGAYGTYMQARKRMNNNQDTGGPTGGTRDRSGVYTPSKEELKKIKKTLNKNTYNNTISNFFNKFKKNNNKNNNKNKNFNKKDFGLGLGAGVGTSSIVSTLTKTKQKKGSGGFRLGGLPGTAHNVGRRTNPQ